MPSLWLFAQLLTTIPQEMMKGSDEYGETNQSYLISEYTREEDGS